MQEKQLFFDLDHTLWDFEKNSTEALAELYDEFNLGVTLNTDFASFHHRYKKINEAMWQDYKAGSMTRELLRNKRFLDTFSHFGHHDKQVPTLISEMYIYKSPRKTHLFEGARETLEWLMNKGYRLHIITNGFNEVQFIKLKESRLEQFFHTVTTSEMAGANKPSPGIFSYALRQASCQPEHAIMIGDNEDADIQGALISGWKSVLFDPLQHNERTEAAHRIKQLSELKNLFG